LNSAKFDIILSMEEQLPVRNILGTSGTVSRARLVEVHNSASAMRSEAGFSRYRNWGQVERIVPFVFGAIYTVELVRKLT